MEDKILNRFEVSELLGINSRTLARWIELGVIPFIRSASGELQFSEAKILTWIAEDPAKSLKNMEVFEIQVLAAQLAKQKFEVGQINQYLNLKKIISLVEAVEEDEWAYREEIIEEDENKNPAKMTYKEKLEKFKAARLNMDSLSVDDPDFNSKFKAAREVIEKWKKILNESDPIADKIESEKSEKVKRIYAKDELQSLIEKTFKGEKL